MAGSHRLLFWDSFRMLSALITCENGLLADWRQAVRPYNVWALNKKGLTKNRKAFFIVENIRNELLKQQL
jgi:hypothetical protein